MFELNVRGIAPSCADVRDAYLQEIPECTRVALADHIAGLRVDANVQKEWSATYRRRWGLQYKTLGIGHELTPDEIRARVPTQCPFLFFWLRVATPKNGGHEIP